MLHKLHGLIVIAAVLTLLFAGNSSAIVVFNDFGVGDAYQADLGVAVAGSASRRGRDIDIAGQFIPAVDSLFDSVDLAASLSAIGGTNALDVALAADNAGVPGATLESFHFIGAMGPFGTANPLLHADSLTHPALHAGVPYWLVASASGDTLAVWNANSTGAIGYALQYDASGWILISDPETPSSAFRILAEDPVAVPEPATLALFGTGAIAAFARRRLQNRRRAV